MREALSEVLFKKKRERRGEKPKYAIYRVAAFLVSVGQAITPRYKGDRFEGRPQGFRIVVYSVYDMAAMMKQYSDVSL